MIYTTLDNFYLTAEQLEDSPSRQDGISADDEARAKVYGCEIVQQAGMLLGLPQVTMATGQVLLHRFYCKQSLCKRDVKARSLPDAWQISPGSASAVSTYSKFCSQVFGMACLFLATKLEETARKHREIISVFHRLERRREGHSLEPLDHYGNAYSEQKAHVIKAEKMILTQLGFILHVDHPHKDMLNYLHYLQASPELMQVAWNFTNDSLRTTLCVRFKSKIVACGIIYTAARTLQEALPEDPPWWEVFSVELADMCMVCREIFKLYHLGPAAYINFSKRANAVAASCASPAPAALTPAISAGQSGADDAQPGSQGPSPTEHDGKEVHQTDHVPLGKSGPNADCRPASSEGHRASQDASLRLQSRHPAKPGGRRSQSSTHEAESRSRQREYRGNSSKGHERRGESDRHRDSEGRRDRHADRDGRHARTRDERTKDRDRDQDRIRSTDELRSHRAREREQPRSRSLHAAAASKPDRSRPADTEPMRDSSKRHKFSKESTAEPPHKKPDEKQLSASSTERGTRRGSTRNGISSSSQST